MVETVDFDNGHGGKERLHGSGLFTIRGFLPLLPVQTFVFWTNKNVSRGKCVVVIATLTFEVKENR